MKIESVENGGIKIRNNYLFLAISIFAAFMSIGGAVLLFNLISDAQLVFSDIFGVAFASVWLSVVFGIGFTSFIMFSNVLILNDKGVTYSSIIKRRFLDWSQVKDLGLSYCGQTRFEGNTYYLYFSGKILQTKNDERKIIKGVKVRVVVLESEYDEVIEKVFTYCKEYADNEPFVPIKKNHFF